MPKAANGCFVGFLASSSHLNLDRPLQPINAKTKNSGLWRIQLPNWDTACVLTVLTGGFLGNAKKPY